MALGDTGGRACLEWVGGVMTISSGGVLGVRCAWSKSLGLNYTRGSEAHERGLGWRSGLGSPPQRDHITVDAGGG